MFFTGSSDIPTAKFSDPENVSLPVKTCAIVEGKESSASGGIQVFEAKHLSHINVVGKYLNEQIENSSSPAKTLALEYTGSEVISG